MKKRLLILVLIIIRSLPLLAQKPDLTLALGVNWPCIQNDVKLSNDGQYVVYKVGSETGKATMVIQATDRSWKREIPFADCEEEFTQDSRKLIFCSSTRDSIGIVDLERGTLRYIAHASGFKMPPDGNGQWLAYRCNQRPDDLVVTDQFNGKVTNYSGTENYLFSNDGQQLVMSKKVSDGKTISREVLLVNLSTGTSTSICKNYETSSFVFNKAGTALAFVSKKEDHSGIFTNILYYHMGMDSAKNMIDQSYLKTRALEVRDIQGFTKDDDDILFILGSINQINTFNVNANVQIRGYEGDDAQPGTSYCAVISLKNHNKIYRLQQTGDIGVHYDAVANNNYGVATQYADNKSNLDFGRRLNLYLVSFKDGARKLIKVNLKTDKTEFSLAGKYISWYDSDLQQRFCYNILKGTIRCITKVKNQHFEIAGWMENDEGMLAYNGYDILRVDPEGVKAPINLTLGFGKKFHTELRWLDFDQDRPHPIYKKDTLILSAFNHISKYNGFFKLILDANPTHDQLQELTMEPRMYYYYNSPASDFRGAVYPFVPLKARRASKYIVERMSATEYPNLFVSVDLKKFRPLTNFEPQKQINWYTTKLYQWKTTGGKIVQGVLFKPQDFDAKKKYPVILCYYEECSDGLNNFILPLMSNGVMNIPWFVSNGYLVFVPDINIMDNYPGKSALNSVTSAAKFLSTFKFVDRVRMGLQGHSYGGFETNYIVSHTSLFAAVASSSGVSDLTSHYLEFGHQQYFEEGQGRIKATLWQRPELYKENSAIYQAGKVTTPVLIMQNMEDLRVNFLQGEEWFSALKRLGKKAWMLSYDEEGHTLEKETDQEDYSIRLRQFFDYYLKGSPPPAWMTQRRNPGLDLDTSGAKP